MMIPLDEHCRPVLARGVRLAEDPITRKPVLLYPEGFVELDDAGFDIVARCSGETTVENIFLSLLEEYDVDEGERTQMRHNVFEYLSTLRRLMLIAICK